MLLACLSLWVVCLCSGLSVRGLGHVVVLLQLAMQKNVPDLTSCWVGPIVVRSVTRSAPMEHLHNTSTVQNNRKQTVLKGEQTLTWGYGT